MHESNMTKTKPKWRTPHGATWNPAGETNPNAVLSGADVRLIRQRLRGGESRQALAREYGVTPSNIRAIAERRSWSHIQ